MEEERDPEPQSQFGSPVQGLLGLCTWSLWRSVDSSSFALKLGIGTVLKQRATENTSIHLMTIHGQRKGQCLLHELSVVAALTFFYLLQDVRMYLKHPQSA